MQSGEADVPCKTCTAPPYLESSSTRAADMPHRRRLRSASTERHDVSTCRQSTVRDRTLPVAGEKMQNGLPSDVTSWRCSKTGSIRTCSAAATKLYDSE